MIFLIAFSCFQALDLKRLEPVTTLDVDVLERCSMTHDLQRILESKRALRRMLASRPVSEKLRMLDALRDRLRAIREAAQRRGGGSANKDEQTPLFD
jgi:hypothetical protein